MTACAVLLAAAFGSAAPDAEACPPRATAAAAEEVAGVLRAQGAEVLIGIDAEGQPLVAVRSGRNAYAIFFSECTREGVLRCADLRFTAEYTFARTITLQQINAYNADALFAKAFARDGIVVVAHGVTLLGGMTRANFEAIATEWDAVLADFADWPATP